jgi:hypothetical protein
MFHENVDLSPVCSFREFRCSGFAQKASRCLREARLQRLTHFSIDVKAGRFQGVVTCYREGFIASNL